MDMINNKVFCFHFSSVSHDLLLTKCMSHCESSISDGAIALEPETSHNFVCLFQRACCHSDQSFKRGKQQSTVQSK